MVSTRKHCGLVAVRQHVRFFVRASAAASFEGFVCVSINQFSQLVFEPFPNGGFESVRRYICELAVANAALAPNLASQIQSPVRGRPSERHFPATALCPG